MIGSLTPVTENDIAIICNYINDEAKANGVCIDPRYVSDNIENVIRTGGAWKIEDGNKIIGFMLWEITQKENRLSNFYIAPKYRVYKNVLVPMGLKLLEVFDGKRLKYTKLHPKVDSITKFANNGYIEIEKIKGYVDGRK